MVRRLHETRPSALLGVALVAVAGALAVAGAPSAQGADPSVEQYGGAGAGISSDVAGGDTSGRECIELILRQSEGTSPAASADRIVARCGGEFAAAPVAAPAEKDDGLPVTGVDMLFLAVGVMLLIMIGWTISRVVLHQTEAAK